jgi:phenylalanyl-tRNA synthetase beta chain
LDLSLKWLSDYINVGVPVKEFADGMTMSGSKVEKWRELSEPLSNIVVGKALSVEKHAGSEKLWVVKLDVGKESPIQIVTAAQNVFEGAYVPAVLDGGVVFNYQDGSVMKIKKGKLRGAESNGMMLGYQEFGVPHDYLPYAAEDGILILNNDPNFEDIKIGQDALEFLGLRDVVVEFEITNNRPDCLSILGLAKEAHAVFDRPLTLFKPTFSGVEADPELSVEVKNVSLCPRYMAAVVKNVKIGPSPRWIQERLRASGVRPINNFVDITNFVMLEYGQPMHAFDKKYVNGNKIIVRNAVNGEKITLLDGSEQILSDEMQVISDINGALAVAGVMGGEHSGIMDDTKTVVFESACFDGSTTRRSAKKIGRRTESSARFEKGLHPKGTAPALYRALQLVETLGCGEVINSIIDIDNSNHSVKRVKHNAAKINEILGSEIHESEQVNIFKKLGFDYDDGYIIPPYERVDIERQCDLAEEVARIYGYNRIKSTVPKFSGGGWTTSAEKFIRKIEQTVIGEGCLGCLTFSFISPKSYEKAGISKDLSDSVTIRNPLGETTSVMRTCMPPSMLEILARNYNNRVSGGRFYEIGRVYLPSDKPDGELPYEKPMLCVGIYGEREDFFTIKGIAESLLENLGIKNVDYIPMQENNTYHPGRCAAIELDGKTVGVIGEVHPDVADSYKIGARVYLAEVHLDVLEKYEGTIPKFKPLPKYPSITRDLSLICDDAAPSGEVEAIIRKNGKSLEEIKFFDLYKGAQIPDGKKSLMYKLVFRKPDATLTDEQIDKNISLILKALSEKNIELRK